MTHDDKFHVLPVSLQVSAPTHSVSSGHTPQVGPHNIMILIVSGVNNFIIYKKQTF